jgi:hypothetical protein
MRFSVDRVLWLKAAFSTAARYSVLSSRQYFPTDASSARAS